MDFFTTAGSASRRASECIIVGVYADGKPGYAAADIDEVSEGYISKLIKAGDITGKNGSCLLLTSVPGIQAKRG